MTRMTPRELKAGMLDIDYDHQVTSTRAGRMSLELREQAQALLEHGKHAEALSLFQQALALFKDDDDSAAAAAACHDLGVALSDRNEGPSLATAEKLFRRALASPTRAAVPRRNADTVNSLAICLRKQAHLMAGEERGQKLEEIVRLYRRAAWQLEKAGPIGLEVLAAVHSNLGNFLWDEKKDHEGSQREYERAAKVARQVMEMARHYETEPSSFIRNTFHNAHLAPASHLVARGRKKDLAEAARLVDASLREGDPRFEDRARMLEAELHLAGDAPDRHVQARKVVARIRTERLKDDEVIALADILRRAEVPLAAIEQLERLIDRGITHRAIHTISDFVADKSSQGFQRAAAVAARIHVQDLQQPVEAFLALENASGLRFSEALSWTIWNPKDVVSRALHERLSLEMGRTWLLDHHLQLLTSLEPQAQQEHLDDLVSKMRELPRSEQSDTFVLDVLSHTRRKSVPALAIQESIEQGRAKVARLRFALAQRDEGYAAREEIQSEKLSASDLAELLREFPGHVLVRLSLEQGELLAVAVWREGETVAGRSATLDVPSELMTLLMRAAEHPEDVSFGRLTQLLAAVDISAAFPPGQWERAVMLPSYLAAMLPLAALGPRGARPIDRFGSLLWLPCLYPLRIRQAPRPPRSGQLVVAPNTTKLHRLALAEPLPGERRLSGDAATPGAVSSVLEQVDTLCLYAHGSHDWGETPLIGLSGGDLNFEEHAHRLGGMERVESWACESGANRPTDPLTPLVDEGFGLDFFLLMQGARSAIGTLWSVLEVVTAPVVRRYRALLSGGADAARALAGAQRWWEQEGLPTLLQLLREQPPAKALQTFASSLGIELDPTEITSPLGLLAPASEQLSETKLQGIAERFSCPVSWAGFRFVGVPERRPLQPWVPLEERPLTEGEHRELEALLKTELPERLAFDDVQEEWLAKARAIGHRTPAPEEAIRVARLMRDRLSSSHRDNLLLGLAWLHEALAAPGLAEAERARLAVEAAHLWLDVAMRERPLPTPVFRERVAMSRAEKLLASVTATDGAVAADADVARARFDLLRLNAVKSREDLHRLARSCLEKVEATLSRLPPSSFEAMRAATTALELLALSGDEPGPAGRKVLEAARDMAQAAEEGLEFAAALHRLCAALDQLEPQEDLADRARTFLTPRELVAVTWRAVARKGPAQPGAVVMPELVNGVLARMEGDLWGYPTDDRVPLLRSVGTPGGPYRRLLAWYLAGHAAAQSHEGAHEIACLQYACDLRLAFLHRLACLHGLAKEEETPFGNLWGWLRIRGGLHTALADAALLHELDSDPTASRPHPHDPFVRSSRDLSRAEDVTYLTAWSLGELCDLVRKDVPPPRTAAFEAALASTAIEETTLELWQRIQSVEREAIVRGELTEEQGLTRLLDPGLLLQANEEGLRNLPAGHGMAGLAVGPSGELLVMTCWGGPPAKGQRSVRIEEGGTDVAGTLGDLLQLYPEDLGEHRGESGLRRKAWAELEKAVQPALAELSRSPGERPLRWGVLAPGALRPLPLLGFRSGGRLMAEQVRGLVHTPSLGFGAPGDDEPNAAEHTACLLARDRERRATRFGEAVIETLRRVHRPQLVLDSPQRPPGKVVEVDLLEPEAPRIRTLRLYGVGGIETLTDTTAALRLEGGQSLRDRNLHATFLPRCAVVELWACTGGPADLQRAMQDDGDRIPGLVASFLASGAAAVIDLAWPVHDVVKALVCQQYGLLRRVQGHGPEVLAAALVAVAEMLSMLRGLPASCGVRDVLSLLDELRRISVQKLSFSASAVVPFEAAGAEWAPSQRSSAELIEELSQPVHLGAFRWWGS